MSAMVGQDWRNKTLRELFIQWQATLLETWHHTTHLMLCFSGSKKISYTDLHPYLSKTMSRERIPLRPGRLFQLQEYKDGMRISILRELQNG